MLTGKKIILFGAGIIGRRALNFFGADRVHCFADNQKAGQAFWGKRVISFEELKAIHNDFDVVISTGIGSYLDIEAQCEFAGIQYTHFHNLITYEDYESNPHIVQFKDIHKAKRCFLIGNGPSLTPEDLNVLHEHGEICFGCNAISKIFDKTPWRPYYYMFGDPVFLLESDMIAETESNFKFIPIISDMYIGKEEENISAPFKEKHEQIVYFYPINFNNTSEHPPFSSDVSKAVYVSGTVLYIMIQFAVYMGYEKIYLLGVDGTAITPKNPDLYMSEKRHFYENDKALIQKQSKYKVWASPDMLATLVTNAYETAEAYTRERGVRIYNATRGGIVKAFERVDFDSLFAGKEGR